MGQQHKRTWEKPELRAIARGRAEESVLASCKNGPIYTASANDYWGGCYAFGGYDPCPFFCSELVNS